MTKKDSSSKILLRQHLRKERVKASKSLSPQAKCNLQLILPKIRIYRSAKHIGLYLPFKSEFPVSPIVNYNLQLKKASYIPRIKSQRKKSMEFVQIDTVATQSLILPHKHQNQHFNQNVYGINESKSFKYSIAAKNLDIVFVPLLGFTTTGKRLGMGGGYYDRLFEFKKWLKTTQKPYLIGLAYQAQLLSNLSTDPWDIPLDAIITEENYYPCKSALL